MNKENALKWFLGCYSENGNHRPDQYTYKCKKCGQWSCTYRSNRIGNYLYECPHCKEYNRIEDIKQQEQNKERLTKCN